MAHHFSLQTQQPFLSLIQPAPNGQSGQALGCLDVGEESLSFINPHGSYRVEVNKGAP